MFPIRQESQTAMHIAILQTGSTSPAMPAEFQDYPVMFADMFAPDSRAATHQLSTVPVIDDVLPDSVDEYDAYIVTGSRHGVYDDLPWIPRLMDFLRAAHAKDKPLIGVCFGHQIIAHALGGYAAKSDRGWGLGVRTVNLHDQPAWIPADDSVRLIHIHQDQVERLPEGATLIGSNDFCPNAMFHIGDSVFCVQGHPEFTIDYIAALMAVRVDLLGEAAIADAVATLDHGHDGVKFASWILSFLDHYQQRRAAA